jgi:hypothetical protein
VKRELKPFCSVLRAAVVLIVPIILLSGAVAQQVSPSAPAVNAPTAPSSSPAPSDSNASHSYAAGPDPLVPAPVNVTPEDWTRLELDPANYALLDPASAGETGNDKFSRELVQLQWRVGDPVEVYVVRPKGVVDPPVVLYLYGYKDNLDRFKNDRYCERLVAGGFAAVGFESALAIDRLRSGRPMKQWFVSELQESLGASVHDVQMVLNYLEGRNDLDLHRAGIFGQGSGGAIAILAAATDPRLKAVDTLNPWGDWSDWLANSSVIPDAERPAFLKPEFLNKVKPLEPVQWLPKSKASAIRLQFVTGSPSLPQPVMEHMETAAAHDTTALHFTVTRYKDTQDLIQQTDGGKLFDWIKAHLRTTDGDGQAQVVPQPDAKPNAAASGKSDAKR